MEHWKYSYDCNQEFMNESNFGIRSWYAIKQMNQTKPLKLNQILALNNS